MLVDYSFSLCSINLYNSVTLAAVKIDSQNMMPGTIVLFTGHVEDTLKRSLKIKTNHIALQKKMFARCATRSEVRNFNCKDPSATN